MLLLGAIFPSLSLLPATRGAARAAVDMKAATTSGKPSLASRVSSLNTMNKMAVMKKAAPKLRGKRLSPYALEVTQNFKREYAKKDVEVLWAALLKIYGSQQAAEAAAKANPQILNPSYSFCNTMLESERVLVDMMGREEAMVRVSPCTVLRSYRILYDSPICNSPI